MDRVKLIHDTVGHTLTVWLGDPSQEYLSTLTEDEVVIMKDQAGRVIGFEVLHYYPKETETGIAEEPFDVTQDPIFQMEGCDSDAPADLSRNLDKYLYREKQSG